MSTIAPSTSPELKGRGPAATRYYSTKAKEASSSQKGLVQDLAGQQDRNRKQYVKIRKVYISIRKVLVTTRKVIVITRNNPFSHRNTTRMKS